MTSIITSFPPLSHLKRLEAESIHIIREGVACFNKPVLLYSIGKDSALMLHLAMKAFAPAPLPFPLLHIDTTWKFREMIAFRDSLVAKYGLNLITHTNKEGLAENISPFIHEKHYTYIMKTQGLIQALNTHGFDAAFGGARRDEEKSRSKERIFSFRTKKHRWDSRKQRPELWNLYNTQIAPGENVRIFPLSNWTELDIWHYIAQEDIPLVPLYFAKERPVVKRKGSYIMVDDNRFPLLEKETPQIKQIRFRTLGCYPLTGAIESSAMTVQDIIAELTHTKKSERQGRMIDHARNGSMEEKKQEGYF